MEAQYIYITPRGNKFYFKDRAMKILHREDGPAIEWSSGSKEWWIDDELHRSDGPAVERADGRKRWYLDGEKLSESEFLRQTAPEIVLTMDEIAAKIGIEVGKLKIKK